MKSKTITITNSEVCAEVNLFLTQDEKKQAYILIQAWHWFGSAWHYQFDTLYFDYPSLAENYINDFSEETARDFVNEFRFI